MIERIAGPLVVARDMFGSNMYDVVKVGSLKLIGEIIKLEGEKAVIQVYEDTNGLRPGEDVESTEEPLSVELGPGLLSSIFDGIQRPLDVIKARSGDFIARGMSVNAIDRKKRWKFNPEKHLKNGSRVKSGEIIGFVQETELIKHYIMVPNGVSGTIEKIRGGEFAVDSEIAVIKSEKGKVSLTMLQRRPVRNGSPFEEKMLMDTPLITGQRVIDFLFPVAKGGTAAIPGPFGSGKCIVGETKILAEDQLTDIRNVFDSAEGDVVHLSENEIVKRLKTPMRVYTFDGKGIKATVVNEMYKGRTEKLIELRTRSGRRVRITPIHKLFALDGDLNIEEKEAFRINKGDFIVSPRKLDIDSHYQKVDINFNCRIADRDAVLKIRELISEYILANKITKKKFAELANVSYKMLLQYLTGRNLPTINFLRNVEKLTGAEIKFNYIKAERMSHQIKVIEYMTEDFAELLGLLMSDGTIRGKKTVIFFNNDEEILKRAESLFKMLFDLDVEYKWQRTVNSVMVHSKALANLLFSLGYPQSRKSRNVGLPKKLLASPTSVLISFLKAYVEGDGSLGENEIEIATASKEMRDGLGYLLLRLGILYRVSKRTTGDWTYHRIFISPKEAAKIYPEYQKDRYFNSSDIVPMNTELFKRILNGIKPYELEKKNIATAGYYVNQNFTVQTFKRVAQELKEVNLAKLVDALECVFCDEVLDVNFLDKEEEVYDLVVPGTHNFIGGDIPMILHNTVMQQALAKFSDADIVIYIGCGERGNEMTEVLTEFPALKDPKSNRPLMERTVLIANTSNMPVAAREASIYTGITIAEYFRDMGYDVAVMADSTSRWAEAMREISSRLEEMPGEEGYPAYLPKRLAEFYERAGRVKALNGKIGSVTVIGAVSPPGGDLSEPVSQGTLRVVKTFWSLDASLASSRHFPAINWLSSYSLYLESLEEWYLKNIGEDFVKARKKAIALLQREAELKDIVQLVGEDSLPDSERALLDVGRLIRESFLRQSAFDEIDAYTSLRKQNAIINTILLFGERAIDAAEKGVNADRIMVLPIKAKIMRIKEIKDNVIESETKNITKEINSEFDKLVKEEGIEEGGKATVKK